MEEKCECKGCGGKVFLGIVITAVVVALGFGGYMVWASSNDDSTSASTTASSTEWKASSGNWFNQNESRIYRFENNATVTIPGELDVTVSKEKATEWNNFIKKVEVVQGKNKNEVMFVVPTSDKSYKSNKANKDGYFVLLDLALYNTNEWNQLVSASDQGLGLPAVLDVSKDGLILTSLYPYSMGENAPSDLTKNVTDMISDIENKNNLNGYNIGFQYYPLSVTATPAPTSNN